MEPRTHSLKAIGVAAGSATLLAPLIFGFVIGLQIGSGVYLSPPLTGLFLLVLNALLFLLFGVTFGAPLLLAICAAAFALGALISALRIRHVVFYILGGMAIAWLGFALIISIPIADPDPIRMVLPRETMAALGYCGIAGAIDGVFYWWLAGRLTRTFVGAVKVTG
jgi:hypothetical protein